MCLYSLSKLALHIIDILDLPGSFQAPPISITPAKEFTGTSCKIVVTVCVHNVDCISQLCISLSPNVC